MDSIHPYYHLRIGTIQNSYINFSKVILLPVGFIRKFSLIYKKKSQLVRYYIYWLKDISNLNLLVVFLILVGIFNTSQIFMKVYL